jgi:hypothetical protein
MKTRKTAVWFCLLGALLVGASSGAAFVMHTVNTYAGTCSKLDGFPGLLQSTGFLPGGKCVLVDGKCPPKEKCEVDGKKGHCVVDVIDHRSLCVCKPTTVSR